MPKHNAFGLGFGAAAFRLATHEVIFGAQDMEHLKEFIQGL
eukprot:CAMPEP_0114696808 /NCGR_PEP_ID=MMETSP0191-20121206/73001_1 /TAXON_ID=126664 /ORGANISM="Sorites sp." /LENGTH=40 /DNA_ID= /DNA_START= /DNA_END= /DNA_ORIENTATION=